jgi:hypothetical protein
MSIKLDKAVEQVGISLAKRGVKTAPIMRVATAFDVSGSAQWLYKNGTMQKTFDRLLAISIKFDDNGELDIWTFGTGCDQLRTATAADESTFVTDEIMNNRKISLWTGTNYSPVLNEMIDFFSPNAKAPVVAPVEKSGGLFSKMFGSKPAAPAPAPVVATADKAIPSFVLFLTDGANSDHGKTLQLLTQLSTNKENPIYIQMVGVGDERFENLKTYADKFDNVGFVNLVDLNVTDAVLFDSLISQELVDWHTTISKV